MSDDIRFRRLLEKRAPVLRYLVETSAGKPELVEALDVSRSTVDRAMDDLLEHRCVRRVGSEYRATTAGRLAAEEHGAYRSATAAIDSAAEFLNYLPGSPPDTDLLEGASVTLATEHAPDRALGPSIDRFERATRMRGLAPVVLGFYPSLVAERLAESDLTVEIVAEPGVVDALPELPAIGERSLSGVDGLSLYESDRELPYALWIMDTPDGTCAGITAYDANGAAGVLSNTAPRAVEWATARYERYRETARAVPVPET